MNGEYINMLYNDVRDKSFFDQVNSWSEEDKSKLLSAIKDLFQLSINPNECDSILITRLVALCRSVSEDILTEYVNAPCSHENIFEKCKDKGLVALNKLQYDSMDRIINTMMLNIATQNCGRYCDDITEQVGGQEVDDFDINDTSFTAVSITSSSKTECLSKFCSFIIDCTSVDNILLDPIGANILHSEMISLLTDGETDEIHIQFDNENGSVKASVGGEMDISVYVLGAMYSIYISNMKKCKNIYGYLGSAPSSELLKGMDYETVCNNLLSTGEFSENEIYLDDQKGEITLVPYQVVMVMNGLNVFQKPLGILMKNASCDGIKSNNHYFIPIIMDASQEQLESNGITFESSENIGRITAGIPKVNGFYMLNPKLLKECTEQPRVLNNVQISDFTLDEIESELKVNIPSEINKDNTLMMLKKVMGV